MTTNAVPLQTSAPPGCPECGAPVECVPDCSLQLSWPRYVNAYEVDRCYGGPEEGGWWYDRGAPLASVPCTTHAEIAGATDRLRDLFAPEYECERDRHSVLGGTNLEIYVEDHVAEHFPETRPHYE